MLGLVLGLQNYQCLLCYVIIKFLTPITHLQKKNNKNTLESNSKTTSYIKYNIGG